MALVLKVLKGSDEGQLLAIPNGQAVVLGRSKEVSYPFEDKLLSREHCKIARSESAVTIQDLESRNGTYVNGERITAAKRLAAGDRIKIGATMIEVTDPATPPPPPPSAAPSLPTIPGFTILECVQVTATGPVYKAEQQLMKRLVLVKTFSTGDSEDERSKRRFMREAKMGGRLNHPSIVELYDVNESDGVMYLVLEYVEGETLESMIRRRGALPSGEVLPWMLQTAEALRYAHQQQVVHRNLRPETIIITREENRAKISDFTVAKRTDADRSIITLAGESLGTPTYMPPEVIRNALAADERSDIYSYAATFYHALSGVPPVEARNLPEFMRKVLEKPPTLAQRVPGIAPALSSIVERAMEKDPANRTATMSELLAALTALGS